jgi:hypothetical protein
MGESGGGNRLIKVNVANSPHLAASERWVLGDDRVGAGDREDAGQVKGISGGVRWSIE